MPASDVIDGRLGDGMEEILALNRGERANKHPFCLMEQTIVVPVVVVATKFDLVITQALIDIVGGDPRFYEKAKTSAHERYARSCRSLFHRNPRDVFVEIVSSM